MVCLGFKLRATGWKAQMNLLRYSNTPSINKFGHKCETIQPIADVENNPDLSTSIGFSYEYKAHE